MKCFYHKSDLDGQCSGAIVKLKFPECEMIGIQYGDPFPWENVIPGEAVWMVDFSLQPFGDMIRLSNLAELYWMDHHKSSLDEAYEWKFMASGGQNCQIGKAGCELTWQSCHPEIPPPRAVTLLGRYDVWDHHNYPGALEFQYGMRNQDDTRPDNVDFWSDILDGCGEVNRITFTGETILAYETRQNAAYVRSCGFEVELDGLRCLAVNKGLTGSLLFASRYDPEKHDAMLAFCLRKSGQWTVSLYSDKSDVDVSEICKARGGGGHKGAAGFQCAILPF